MKRIYYGTKNKAKVDHMNFIIKELDIFISPVEDHINDVVEKGSSIMENARIKALHYYKQLKKPVFSCDSGLFFDHLPMDEQPGIFIRRVNGKRLSDDEMIVHYGNIAKKNNGEAICRYRNAICLVINENEIYEYDGISISSEPFKIVAIPHVNRRKGFPIDSLSVDIESNKYFFDINDNGFKKGPMFHGYVKFFRGIKDGLCE